MEILIAKTKDERAKPRLSVFAGAKTSLMRLVRHGFRFHSQREELELVLPIETMIGAFLISTLPTRRCFISVIHRAGRRMPGRASVLPESACSSEDSSGPNRASFLDFFASRWK
jgi:hypothetical protein